MKFATLNFRVESSDDQIKGNPAGLDEAFSFGLRSGGSLRSKPTWQNAFSGCSATSAFFWFQQNGVEQREVNVEVVALPQTGHVHFLVTFLETHNASDSTTGELAEAMGTACR